MDEMGKTVAELSDEKRLWDLALLCDIRHHLNSTQINFRNKNYASFLICLGLSDLSK
jgi:hypothetical protein